MTAARRFLLLTCLLAVAGQLAGAIEGLNRLESVEPSTPGEEPGVVFRFSRRPEFVRVPLENSLVLVLDFVETAFEPIKKSLDFDQGPIRSLGLTQFSRDRVRLSLKLARRARVEIFRQPQGEQWVLTLRVVTGGRSAGEPDTAALRAASGGGSAVVVLDAGHGGRDEGARGRSSREKDVTLAVALAARDVFQRDPRIKVYLTRSSDRYVALDERSSFADRVKANVFVSIHANSTKEGNPSGVEIYFLSLKGASDEESRRQAERENSAGDDSGRSTNNILEAILDNMVQTSTINQSSKLANILMRKWTRVTGQKPRGIRQAGFRVLKPVNIPSVLVETGFISNSREERLLAEPRYHDAVGKVLYQSVVEYLTSAGQL
ncbi:MAG: N-acetylmuramoyl-L-alanine amidase [Candidatus Wallbacteria bacterium]|nr:N-acetylmuramoyl-L-alanine amidase [Candidatus Wallbacteria bacterium]